MSPASEPLLQVRGVVKTFPGVRALNEVDFDLRRGEVHALVGENGAGKSTLMHVLGGVYRPDAGQVFLNGRETRFATPHDAAAHGIGVVFQELSVSDNLSIAENILANRQPVNRLGLVDRKRLHAMTREVTFLFGWSVDPATPVGELSGAKKQVVEILKAVSRHPQILVLDEPTSSLTAAETALLFENVRRLRDEGLAIIYISHHLGEVFELADRVTVLRDGQRVHTGPVAGITEEELVRKMVGRELADMYGRRQGAVGEERFRAEGLRLAGRFEGVSFSVGRGEIVGVAGLAGAGRTELARSIFGFPPPDGGQMYLDGSPLGVRSPREAIDRGIAYLSEDRKQDGLFLGRSIRDNCVAPSLGAFAGPLGLVRDGAVTAFAEECRRRFGIATPGVWQEAGNLSGGNQQKVLLSMWVGAKPALLLADEPTRGVDVGARSEIYHFMRGLAGQGVGIVLLSSDLPEVLGLSDRILVMRAGRLVAELPGSEATEEQIIAHAAGVGSGAPESGRKGAQR